MPVAPAKVTLYGADGAPVQELGHESFSTEELALLANYKKFLELRGYQSATFCVRCWEHDLSDGCEAHVKVNGLTVEAMIKCRCRVAYAKGSGVAQ